MHSALHGWLLALEFLICFGYTVVFVVFGLFVTLHHAVIATRFGASIPDNQVPLYLAVAASSFGIVAALVAFLKRNSPGVSTWLRGVVSAGLLCGVAGVVLLPRGSLPQDRLASPNLEFELFSSLLPCLAFLHIGFLARHVLLASAPSGGTSRCRN